MGIFLKKKRKYKYINGVQGVISLFLCLLMTPFLMIASALIEFSRYQNVEEIFGEVMDASSLSVMANYDKYLQERFGLFAVSQDCDINETYKNLMLKNSAVMEGISIGDNINASGMLPLSQPEAMKRQILDFSESTVLTEIILEDLNLQTLLDELDKLMNIGGLLDTLSATKNMTQKVKELVETGEAFIAKVDTAVSAANKLKRDVDAFTTSIADLYKKIYDDGLQADSIGTETESDFLKSVVDNYLEDIKTVYNNASTVIADATQVKDAVTSLPGDLAALKTDFEEASEAVQAAVGSFGNISDASKTGSAGQGEGDIKDTSDEATSLYQSVLTEVEKAINSASESLNESTINALKSAAEGLESDLKEGLGLDVTKRWNLQEYYKFPMSEEAKEDIKELLSELPKVWEDGSYNKILQTLSEKFIPKALFMDGNEIKNTISNAINNAKISFETNAKQSLGSILSTLVNAIKGLFDLDFFYDGSLNACLDDATIASLLSNNVQDANNPYVNLLNSISSMLSAVDNFSSGLSGWNFFKIIEGIGDLITSVEQAVTSIVNLTGKTVQNISELTSHLSSGDWDYFAERLLIAGYMTHNLPNRTMVGSTKITVDDNVSYKTVLNGETLTGYKYSDIMTPDSQVSPGVKEENKGGLESFSGFMGQTSYGGTDKMFKGAELEYIMAGTPSEIMNQSVVFMQIYFLRLLLDMVPVFTDPGVTTMASAASIACWAVYLIEVFAEPLCDTILLVNGSEDVCFIKRSCYLTPKGLLKLAPALSDVAIKNAAVKKAAVDSFNQSIEGKLDSYTNPEAKFKDGILKMGYDTHCLLILMFTTTPNDMLRNFAGIVQIESNYHYSKMNAPFTFAISNAYTGISSSADAEFDSFIKIFQTNNASSLVKKTFTGTQTY